MEQEFSKALKLFIEVILICVGFLLIGMHFHDWKIWLGGVCIAIAFYENKHWGKNDTKK